MFDEVIEEVKEFEQCDFKKTLADKKDDYLDSLSEGKDVDESSVTAEEVSTTHRRRDLDSL